MPTVQAPALLFEMMRSFATLARTLNLSAAVRELGSTRQTVRRHIALLEEYKGAALFNLEDRQYSLTQLGRDSLGEAITLLARGEAWLHNEASERAGLFRLAVEAGPVPYLLQQHPLSEVWQSSSPLLRWGFHIWAGAEGRIESEAFAPLRPYLMVFRPNDDGWICTEVGEKSSFATWFGWKWERSSVGRGIADLPGGEGFARLLTEPFRKVQADQGIRLDHIFTKVRRTPEEELEAISYHRLALGCRFPDGSFALATLVDRTYKVLIDDLPEDMRTSMPEAMVMDVTPPK